MSSGAELTATKVNAWYGAAQVLRDVTLQVPAGGVFAVLGRNGAGKSTLLKAMMGLVTTTVDGLTVDDVDLARHSRTELRARAGVAYVPEDRRVFTTMTVAENLLVACRAKGAERDALLDHVHTLFPVLKRRATAYGDQLSGGEQQMLSIGRALMSDPRVLLIDEPCEGLAPSVVAQLGDGLETLAQEGRTIVLVEQSLRLAPRLATRAAVLSKGEVVWNGDMSELMNTPDLMERLLGVSSSEARAPYEEK